MITIRELNSKTQKIIKRYHLEKKVNKQISLIGSNPSHPSLHTELLEPKDCGIYSFRIDRKFRALFIFREHEQCIEILTITLHYH